MNIGYTKGVSILKDDIAYQKKLDKLNVVKIYADKHGEAVALNDMLKYARQGDTIVVEDVQHLCNSLGGFIELALNLKQRGIHIRCKHQHIDTSMVIWDDFSSMLQMFNRNDSDDTQRGRKPRHLEDLDDCFDLVEQGVITVTEACKQMNISRSTYYRRWREVTTKIEKERHPERFEEYEQLVQAGKITVTRACQEMNIGITSYYRLRASAGQKEST